MIDQNITDVMTCDFWSCLQSFPDIYIYIPALTSFYCFIALLHLFTV